MWQWLDIHCACRKMVPFQVNSRRTLHLKILVAKVYQEDLGCKSDQIYSSVPKYKTFFSVQLNCKNILYFHTEGVIVNTTRRGHMPFFLLHHGP
uniref:Uncharacterized protein n=1 Tax=Triticum urartu TaxID=4572 RepID=A0A8R7R6W8_TRIUA